jgi:hypothetical protein
MAAKTAAQEEFDSIFTKNTESSNRHPEDDHDSEADELSEEQEYANTAVESDMMLDMRDQYSSYKLPPSSFDSGRTTGVKGVIADARSYDQAKKATWRSRSKSLGKSAASRISALGVNSYKKERRESGESDEDEEFLERWREARRMEIEREGNDIRNRRTSPSVRRFGRFDEVDALGYLDAIEKVGRETVVVVFVYDHEVRLPSTPPFRAATNHTRSARSAKSSSRRSSPSSAHILLFILSRSITRTLSLTMLASQPSWATRTKAISLPT